MDDFDKNEIQVPGNSDPVINEIAEPADLQNFDVQMEDCKNQIVALHRRIGEKYCEIHKDDPEDALKDDVISVNTLVKTMDDLNHGFQSGYTVPLKPDTAPYTGPHGVVALLCGNALTLVFAILVTASLLLGYISNFGVIAVIMTIPEILYCISLWIIYVQSSKGTLKTTGFSIINGVLTYEMILTAVAFVIMGLAGILIIAAGGSDYAVTGIIVLLMAVVPAFPVLYYFYQLKKTTMQARSLANGEVVTWNASVFVIVVLFVEAIGKVSVAITALAGNSAIEFVLNNFGVNILDGLSSTFMGRFAQMLESALYELFRTSILATVTSCVSGATVIVAIMILLQIRGQRNGGY